ncbi:uncharacterized protein JN550_013503 [Neoarthrinium moseri]|uniref:uncharacterized protein n=1 Tax=Neoarthrinium moseri TaxID=1658444 RepID=UPI001FDBEA9B|nr:uncharacterized protein JN550_013503 [Neoarthrinium moseri]KAI1857010.1 hypothetical protein JN550_013503 [Neoarthrinium moseri]
MSRQLFYGLSVLLPILAILLERNLMARSEAYAPIIGRANVTLFLVNSEAGLSNVFAATAQALLEQHPTVTVHFASFSPIAPQLERISSYSRTQSLSHPAPGIIFHELPDLTLTRAIHLSGRTMSNMAHPPGLGGIDQICRDIQFYISPWSGEDHYVLYQRLVDIIDQVDPAVIVLDTVFRPGIDATRERKRLHAFISPNTLIDNFAMDQPWGSMFWKYPLAASGIPYPVPWRRIPENIYLTLRFIYAVFTMSNIKEKQAFLKSKDLSDPINFYNLHRPEVPWFTGFTWMKSKAEFMALALAQVLEQTDLQVLWKFQKDTNDANLTHRLEYDDTFLEPLRPFLDRGRVRTQTWLSADPTALLKTGHIVVSVHHGGSGCYHEAIATGVPQLVLPQWFDLYNFAQLTEDIGVGVWGCRETSPHWTVECLRHALLRVVRGESGRQMKERAAHFEEAAQNSPGQQAAAREIARLASSGKTA